MSRHISPVDPATAEKVLGVATTKVAHGYDVPLSTYFCDAMPDCEEGIWYGVVGMTKRLNKGDYFQAMKDLGLEKAANAVALDIPY